MQLLRGDKVAAVRILSEEVQDHKGVAYRVISENMNHAIKSSGNFEICAKNFLFLYSPKPQVVQPENLNIENITNSERTVQILKNHLGLVYDVLEPRAIHSIAVAFGESFEEVYEQGQDNMLLV